MDDFTMTVHHTAVTPVSFVFADDGMVPNNPLPFLIYKSAFEFEDRQPEEMIQSVFDANGWGQQMWRNGVFDYLHYHATVHEVLGVARGRALVRFGGNHGEGFEIRKGDAAVLPAAPVTNACLQAAISSSSVLIRLARKWRSRALRRKTIAKHCGPFQRLHFRKQIRSMARKDHL
jgi:uncharacterized protein YjlB